MPNLFGKWYMRATIDGLEILASCSGPAVLMAHHVSPDDIRVLHQTLPPQVRFAVHRGYEELCRRTLRHRSRLLYDPLRPESLSAIDQALREGAPVLLFPENKPSAFGTVQKIYPEFVALATKNEAAIIPVMIRYPESPSEPVRVYVKPPLSAEAGPGDAAARVLARFQEEMFELRRKKRVNLFDEMVRASRGNINTYIIEEVNRKLSYRDLISGIHALSYPMEALLGGERTVGTFLPTSIGYTFVLFALFKLGITPAALNITIGVESLADCLLTAQIKTVITSREFEDKGGFSPMLQTLSGFARIIYLEDIQASVTASQKLGAYWDYRRGARSRTGEGELILFTSGSEGRPKGVVLTHDNIYNNVIQLTSVIEMTQHDRALNVLPMYHCFGLTVGTLLPLLMGFPVLLYPSPVHFKAVPELAYRFEATMLFGTSTFYNMYGQHAHPFDFHRIRYALAGAEKLKREVADMWFEKFGIRILEGYGATETSPILSLNTPLLHKRGTVGCLMPGMEYAIEPVEGIGTGGSLLVNGPNAMKGYILHDQGFTPRTGWVDTGDIVTVDDEGFFSIVGRRKRFAKIAGEMVSLDLVERLASRCFGSQEFVACSVAHRTRGEQIVLLTSNVEASLQEFRRFVKDGKHSPLIIPEKLEWLASIPILGSGKTDYVSIQRIARERTGSEEPLRQEATKETALSH